MRKGPAHSVRSRSHTTSRSTRGPRFFLKSARRRKCSRAFQRWRASAGAADAERDIRGFALKFYTEEGNWDLVGNNTPVFFLRDPLKFPDLNHAIKRDPRTGLRSAESNWDFWTQLPEALHQVTIVMSERGIPKTFRHMHGFGSHTFSFISAAHERYWVKFHFRSQQGIENLTDAQAEALVGRDPRNAPSRPVRSDRAARVSALDAVCANHAGERSRRLSDQSVRSDQGLAEARLSADRSRRDGVEPQSRQSLCRCRAGRLCTRQRGAGHQFLARQDVARPAVFVWRRATLPVECQLSPGAGECAAWCEVRAQLPSRRAVAGGCEYGWRHAV